MKTFEEEYADFLERKDEEVSKRECKSWNEEDIVETAKHFAEWEKGRALKKG